jgi:hypothetical protein
VRCAGVVERLSWRTAGNEETRQKKPKKKPKEAKKK